MKSAAYATMHNTTVDTHLAVHCWWMLGEGHRGFGQGVRELHCQDQLEDAEGRRLQHACEAKKVVCFRPSGLRKQTACSLKALAD